MKKLIILTTCFVAACIIFSFSILPNLNKAQANNTSEPKVSSSLTYTVKNFNGNVAVFEAGSNKPFKVTEVQINTLPFDDQKNLEEGITVTSKEQLNSLLEDLCS